MAWALLDAMNDEPPEESPQSLLEYFRGLASLHPDREYARGALLTEAWIALAQDAQASEAQFRELFDRVEDVSERPGSGYFDLWLRVRHWGYRRGFAVPEDHPWRVDPRLWECTSCGPFAGQIEQGKEYRAGELDDARALVRIVNDQGRTRWYPYQYFRQPSAI